MKCTHSIASTLISSKIITNIVTHTFLTTFEVIENGVLDLGKRKVLSESHLKELVTPQKGELLGRVIKLVGGDNIIVKRY